MNAQDGDWLVVESLHVGEVRRVGKILRVGADGAPPFTVRWKDTDHESVVFPGPGAHVVPPDRIGEVLGIVE